MKIEIKIYQADRKIKFSFESNELNLEQVGFNLGLKFKELQAKQTKLQALGLKANFFGLKNHSKTYIDIDVTTETDKFTAVAGFTCKLADLKENAPQALQILLPTFVELNQTNELLTIED